MRNLLTAVLLAALVSGCVATSAVPISQNVWRLETRGDGALGTDFARRSVLRDAAALTLRNGYTHFTLRDAADFPSPVNPVRLALFGDVRVVQFSNAVPVPPEAAANARREPTVYRAVTVVMYREGDAIPAGAYEALATY